MRTRWLLLVGAVALAGCGGGGPSPPKLPASLARLYAYNRDAPFDLQGRVIENRKIPVKVHDVSFLDSRGSGVVAYLCVPPGKGPFAGAVFVPGSGGIRADFLVQAIQLAARGAVTITMLTPFIHGAENEPTKPLADARFYRTHFEDNVVAIRRAFDLLERRSDVDPKRLGLVGYSLGATLSSVVSGVDPRPAAVVLVAPPSHPHFYPPLRGRTATRAYRILAPVDPKQYLRRTRARLFLEMARHDEIEIRPEQHEVLKAVGRRAEVKWYPTGHHMNRQAWSDVVRWLGDQLRLGPLPRYAQLR